jgi:ketosteroid isomerase-like protein
MSFTTDRAEIEAFFQQLVRAHADHDADAIVEAYAPDAVIYDLAPPLGHRGMNRDSVAAWLAGWDGPIQIDARDVNLTVDGDLAFASALKECAGAKAVKTRTCGAARRFAFGRRAGDGASSTITPPCPSTWMGAIAPQLILNRSGSRGMKVRSL